MSTFQDCIVSYVDLNNVKDVLNRQGKKGVRIMLDLHRLVSARAPELRQHQEVCFWQDSVLLLAPVDPTEISYTKVMSEVRVLKDAIHERYPCHAVCVKGQSFPPPASQTPSGRPRVIYLSASSLAFSNCFDIESRLKKHKADWYIDSRITSKIQTRAPDCCSTGVPLLPRNVSPRDIHVFWGSFL